MRALATIIIIGLMVLSALNWMAIQSLRKDVLDLRKGRPADAAASTLDHAAEARDLVERAGKHIAEANGYIEKNDLKKAKASLDEAVQELDTAAGLISEKSTDPSVPLIDRLRGAADTVEKHLPRKGEKK